MHSHWGCCLSPGCDQGLVLLNEPQVQFGGEGDVGVGQAAVAEQHLLQVGAVAQHGFGAVLGFVADEGHSFALEDELFEDHFLWVRVGPMSWMVPWRGNRLWCSASHRWRWVLMVLGDGFAFEVAQFGAVGAGFDFFGRQEIQDHGGEAALGNSFAVGACFVFVDGAPDRLAGAQVGGGGEEGLAHLADGLDEDLAGMHAAQLRAFLEEENLQGTVEALVDVQGEGGLVVRENVGGSKKKKKKVAYSKNWYTLSLVPRGMSRVVQFNFI